MNWVMMLGIVVTVVTAIPVVLQLRTHPRGLFVLFFAEMWERFSYYGMRGLLIFYLTQQFLFDDKFSQNQYGAYTSLVYLMPLIGGFVADRFLGMRKAIIFGALLLVAGHLTMGIEGPPAKQMLNYNGAAYEFQVDGRGDTRHIRLKVGDGVYDYASTADGGLQIKGLPANAPLPSVMPQGSYKLSVADRDPIYVNILYLALSLIIMGVGFMKANISSIAGQLYPQGDPRRDAGFTLYYYGMNLGAFWAAIACGWLGETVGWWAGFGAAGAGMLLGFVVFVLGRPLLLGKGEPPEPKKLIEPLIGPLNREWIIYILGIIGVVGVWALLRFDGEVRDGLGQTVAAFKAAHGGARLPLYLSMINVFAVVGSFMLISSVAVLGYLGWFMVTKCDKVERERMTLALVLIAASVIFWTLFEQAGSSLNQFADRNTNLTLTATQSIGAAQVQSFNAGFILIFAPVFSALWAFLGRRRLDPNPSAKFGLALLQVGAGFLVLVWGSQFADAHYRVPLIFLALAYLLHTTGELCLSPVGMSQMTKLSPPAVVATAMAIWFLGLSWAQWIGGLVANLTASETVAGQVLDPAKALATYVGVFKMIGLWGVAVGVVMLALSPLLKRWAHGADQTTEPHAVVDGDVQAVDPAALHKGA